MNRLKMQTVILTVLHKISSSSALWPYIFKDTKGFFPMLSAESQDEHIHRLSNFP